MIENSYINLIRETVSKIDAQVLLVRKDGMTLYNSQSNSKVGASAGALIAGMWGATTATLDLFGGDNVAHLRLACDNSESGIYVVSVGDKKTQNLLAFIFQKCLNPGKLKVELVKLKNKLDGTYLDKTEDPVFSKNENQNLFDKISDAEIDQLFSFHQI